MYGEGPKVDLTVGHNFLFLSFHLRVKYDTKMILTDFARFPWKSKPCADRAKRVPALYDKNIFQKENLVVTMKWFSKLKAKA